MSQEELLYSIQQVSEMTGISKQLVRKWEDRYNLVNPKRLDNGYRMYTVYEVNLIKAVAKLVQSGHSVKQAVALVQSPDFNFNEVMNEEPTIDDLAHTFLNKLELAGADADDKKILYLLQQAHHTLGIQQLIDYIVVPYLKRIGELWCDQAWAEYQEAIASQTVRDFLANLRRGMFVPESAPLVVGSCLPNEYHEIPMHILLVQCSLKGYRTMMLGQSPAPKAIESIVNLKKPKFVLLTASTHEPFKNGFQTLYNLDTFASSKPETTFLLGGYGALNAAEHVNLKSIEIINSIDKLFH